MTTFASTVGFWRSVGSVLTGTALAQAVPIAGSLVIARLYAPADFGRFSAWLGMVLLAGVALTGRLEAALALEPDGEPRRRAVVATAATVALSVLVVAVLLSMTLVLAPASFQSVPRPLLVMFLPAAALVALGQTWQSWAAAEGLYRELSWIRIAEALCVTSLQVAAGVAFASADALATSQCLGLFLAFVVATRLLPLGLPKDRLVHVVGETWRRHRRFPLLSLPADAINTAAAQLPVLIIAARFGADVAGLLALAFRTLGAPTALLGKAVLDVFKRQASNSYRERGECRTEYTQTFRVLAALSIAASVVVMIGSEPFFALAFGERWRTAGTMAIWLMPMFALRFVSSPLSYMSYIAGKQHLDLAWQVCLLAMTLATLYLPDRCAVAILSYSAGYSLLYVGYLLMSYRFSRGGPR
ncbi:MAG: lipopolysaccharide biosynthesis protein [Burkholderiaceae bacterium]|nr:lipopolysaccharide biosynthesis protein [Burkholderiaceae bacterium]